MAQKIKIMYRKKINALSDHFEEIQKRSKQKATGNRQSSDSERCRESHYRSSSSACAPLPPHHPPSSSACHPPSPAVTYMKQRKMHKKSKGKIKKARDMKALDLLSETSGIAVQVCEIKFLNANIL